MPCTLLPTVPICPPRILLSSTPCTALGARLCARSALQALGARRSLAHCPAQSRVRLAALGASAPGTSAPGTSAPGASATGASATGAALGAALGAAVAAGRSDRATGRQARTADKFVWGSVTKLITGASVLRLVDQGVISLSDPVPPLGEACP